MSSIASLLGLPFDVALLSYVGLVAALLSAILLWFQPTGRALAAIGVIAVWLGYAGSDGVLGVLADPARMPPGSFRARKPNAA